MSASPEKGADIKVLLNPDLVRRLNPWELKVYILLELFRKYLESMKLVDFRLSGVALSTSSLIYELKAKRILYEPRHEARQRAQEEARIDLRPYVLIEVPSTDLNELVEAFRELVSELARSQLSIPKAIEPSEVPLVGELSVLEAIKKYEDEVIAMLEREGRRSLYDLLSGRSALEVIRYFLAVLFLLSEGRIDISESLEIFIPEKGSAQEGKA